MTKLAALWAWLTANAIALIVIVLLAVAVFVGMRSCQDKDDSADATVMKERIRVDSLRAIGDSVALAETRKQLSFALANGVQLVDRWRNSPPPSPPKGSPHDSIVYLTNSVKACRDAGDGLAASIVKIKSACEAYRDTATRSIATLREGIAHRDTLLEIRARPKRVQPYGAGLYDVVNRRPVFRVGTTVKALWKIHGMGEAEYAIPSAVKTESGDGLRLLAGVRVNF